MSEVVPFPEAPGAEDRRRRSEEFRREQKETARLEAARLEDRRMLLERARKAMEQRRRMSAASERRTVARNLWDMLDRLEKGPAARSKADVLLAAGRAQPGDSTKHLERYALRPGLPEAEEKKKSEFLVQRIKAYVDIARKAAELAGTDPDTAEFELLQGSSYLSDAPHDHMDDPDARAADIIALALRRMADRLSQRFDLKRYFERCERHRLVPEPPEARSPRFVVAEYGTLIGIDIPHTISGSRVTALDRCPGVYLGSVIADEAMLSQAFATLHRDEDDEDWPIELKARRIPTWDVHVRFGPFGPSQSVVPILDVRPVTRIKPRESGNVFASPDEPVWFYHRITLGEHSGHPDSPCSIDIAQPEERIVPPMYEAPDEGFWLTNLVVAPDKHPANGATGKRHQPSAELKVVSLDSVLSTLKRPLFFRHYDETGSTPAPVWWTDERASGSVEVPEYYFPIADENSRFLPTVATEGTLLARLERWMHGTMPVDEFFESVVSRKLEEELSARAERLVHASDTALQEAEERLKDLLQDPTTSKPVELPNEQADDTLGSGSLRAALNSVADQSLP